MIDPLAEPTRLVVVTSGFGLWREGRHELSARWGDVIRVRTVPAAPVPTVAVEFADGRELRIDAALSGWEQFLAAAPGALLGTRGTVPWLPLPQAAGGAIVLLYERRAPRQRSLQ